MNTQPKLDRRIRELVAVGASIAGNCLPCLRYHLAEALKAGCTPEEISEAIELSKRVKERPIQDIYRLANELLQREPEKTPAITSQVEGE